MHFAFLSGPPWERAFAQVNGEFVPFPTQDQLEESDLDLIVSGRRRLF